MDTNAALSDFKFSHNFSVGKDAFNAHTLAVGPARPQIYQASNGLPDVKGPIEFLADMFEAIIPVNHLDTVLTCVTDADSIDPKVEELVGDIKGGNMIEAAELAKKIFGEILTTFSACEAMSPSSRNASDGPLSLSTSRQSLRTPQSHRSSTISRSKLISQLRGQIGVPESTISLARLLATSFMSLSAPLCSLAAPSSSI